MKSLCEIAGIKCIMQIDVILLVFAGTRLKQLLFL